MILKFAKENCIRLEDYKGHLIFLFPKTGLFAVYAPDADEDSDHEHCKDTLAGLHAYIDGRVKRLNNQKRLGTGLPAVMYYDGQLSKVRFRGLHQKTNKPLITTADGKKTSLDAYSNSEVKFFRPSEIGKPMLDLSEQIRELNDQISTLHDKRVDLRYKLRIAVRARDRGIWWSRDEQAEEDIVEHLQKER